MTTNPYLVDMLAQPAALQAALDHYQADDVAPLAKRFAAGEFSRVVLTGMGSSHNSHYAANLIMSQAKTPTIYINTAEVLHYAQSLLQPGTLLWINSQSGRSVEIVRLLEQIKNNRPAFQLSITNQPTSPTAQAADLALLMHAGDEATVSTKTYLNSVAVSMLAATQLVGGDHKALLQQMRSVIKPLADFFNQLDRHTATLDAMTNSMGKALFLGRGPSMGAIMNGSLVNTEASKVMITGMNVADFRHGPFEMVDGSLTLFILEGNTKTASLNRQLALEAHNQGAHIIWLSGKADPVLPTFLLPDVPDAVKPLVEILAFQVMTLVNAKRTGFEPGVFRHIGKVTVNE